MSREKHTPAPWRPSVRPDGSASVQSDGWGPIAEVHVSTKPMPGEVEANARLIAAAPSLLSALEAQEEAESLNQHLNELWAQRAVDSVAGFVAPELEQVILRLTGELKERTAKAKELRQAALRTATEG